jgi:hypothetical protein
MDSGSQQELKAKSDVNLLRIPYTFTLPHGTVAHCRARREFLWLQASQDSVLN